MQNFAKTLTLENGKAGAISFDFNREMHRIEHAPGASNEEQRVVLKVHYLITPKAFTSWYGKGLGYLTVKYNETFRFLFNSTIEPKGLFWKFMATQVIAWTWIFNSVESLIGMNNFAFYVLAGLSAVVFRSYSVFLLLTSYLHYLMYISTYYHREKVSFGQFKRNAVVYKTISVVQILGLYAYNMYQSGTVDALSMGMIAAGWGLSFAATQALGIDRTYFGWELGHLKGEFVQKWPYGPNGIPHPMIVVCITWLMGIHKLDAFRAAWPWVVPCHVALYMCHLLQVGKCPLRVLTCCSFGYET